MLYYIKNKRKSIYDKRKQLFDNYITLGSDFHYESYQYVFSISFIYTTFSDQNHKFAKIYSNVKSKMAAINLGCIMIKHIFVTFNISIKCNTYFVKWIQFTCLHYDQG